jgi:SAM-dependent methyltransferase
MKGSRIHRAPHQVVRYAPVLRAVRGLREDARILEVGSGAEGLGTWERRPFVGADLAFPRSRLPRLRAVVADGSHLPFPDRTFDLVACVDVLTDVPRSLVAPICSEMARVARGSVVVVNVCGRDAEASDRGNLEWCRRHGIVPPAWLVQQVGRGTAPIDEVEDALGPFGRLQRAPNTSVAWNDRLFRLEQRMRRARLMTAAQPVIQAWGRLRPSELGGSGPTYRWRFTLEVQETSSPPARRS